MFARIVSPVLLLILAAPLASARFARPDIEEVPIERLIENLEKRLADHPDETYHHHSLARLHSMAFAYKGGTTWASRRSGPGGQTPYFGHGRPPAAFPVREAPDDAATARAAEHLEQAIAHYDLALEQSPDDRVLALGRAWCTEQAGRTDDARDRYRKIFEAAWQAEKDTERWNPGDSPVTTECGRYLLALLDAEADADERARIEERIAHIEGQPRWITPIVIPLDDEATLEDLVDPAAGVRFDLDGSGRVRSWGWVTGRGAWLVHDPTGSGRITSGLQIFGAVTWWVFWPTGYDALAALDDDGDGRLTGDELQGLALWRDADGDGRSDPGEVRPVAEHRIVALEVRSSDHRTGIPWNPAGVRLADGTTRPSYDWYAPTNE